VGGGRDLKERAKTTLGGKDRKGGLQSRNSEPKLETSQSLFQESWGGAIGNSDFKEERWPG